MNYIKPMATAKTQLFHQLWRVIFVETPHVCFAFGGWATEFLVPSARALLLWHIVKHSLPVETVNYVASTRAVADPNPRVQFLSISMDNFMNKFLHRASQARSSAYAGSQRGYSPIKHCHKVALLSLHQSIAQRNDKSCPQSSRRWLIHWAMR